MTDRSSDPSVLAGRPVVVLSELRVENLLLIERAELTLAPGLNVLTGETGAGKTVLAHALDLLMGGRSRSGIVRSGSQEAYVEGVFAVPERLREQIAQSLPESAKDNSARDDSAKDENAKDDSAKDVSTKDDESDAREELVLARRVFADGRTRAYVNGRSAAVGDLRELGGRLISFYGQHEHRKLVLAGAQLEMLDEACGADHAERLESCARSFAQTRRLESELQRLGELAQARERELDLLEHELTEIEQAEPEEDEHTALLVRRERLRRIDALRVAAGGAADALAADSPEQLGAVGLLADASARLQEVAGIDARLDVLGERCSGLAIEAQDIAGELRGYCQDIEAEDGASLGALEERLATLERLMRKHGGSISTMLQYAESARARRDELLGAQSAQEETQEMLVAQRRVLEGHVEELRAQREKTASTLAEGVREQLAELAMADATFEITLTPTEPKATGGDAVEFVIAPNPGVAGAPLREIASGGELSRIMLALTSACSEHSTPGASSKATLVFDEIDAGIGGHTARAVGERLQTLARGRQLVCITHLPQIAALADRHFSVAKDSSEESTVTTVLALAEREVVTELVRMLGAEEQDATARRHARELRRVA